MISARSARRLTFVWTGREAVGMMASGISARAGGSIFAPVWSVPTTWGEIHGVLNWSLNLYPKGPKPTIAFRVGGKSVLGDYPFMNAAYIGGGAHRPQPALQSLCR